MPLTILQANTWRNSGVGFALYDHGNIGQQGRDVIIKTGIKKIPYDNKWFVNTSASYFIAHTKTYFNTDGSLSPFVLRATNALGPRPPYFPFGMVNTNDGSGSPIDSIPVSTTKPVIQCKPCKGPKCPVDPTIAKELAEEIVQDKIPFSTDTVQNRRLVKHQLFHMMKHDSTIAQMSQVLQQFEDSMKTTSIGKLCMVTEEMVHLTPDSPPADFQAVTDTLNIIVPTCTMETNMKTVRTIYTHTIAKGIDTFNTQQYNNLQAIAYQCPFDGGPGVYEARAMLSLIDPFANFDSLCNINIIGNNARKGNFSEKENEIEYTIVKMPYYGITSIYPNPVEDEIIIHYTLPDNTENVLMIINAIGEKIKEYKADNSPGVIVMNVAYLKQGLYIAKLTDNKSFVDIRRIIINK